MITYGWDKEDLYKAIDYVNSLYAPHKGIPIEIRELRTISRRCRKGKQTLRFTLGFSESTRRHKNGDYSPGVSLKYYNYCVCLKPIIPFYDIIGNNLGYDFINRSTGYISDWREGIKTNGHLCWHSFGHFMAYLFKTNPEGKIKTGYNIYDGEEDFLSKAFTNLFNNKFCSCTLDGLHNFFIKELGEI